MIKVYRTIITGFLLLTFSINLFAQTEEIIISEISFGENNNKAIELYNPTSHYFYLDYFGLIRDNDKDGNFSVYPTILLTGELGPGQTYVVASDMASQAIKDKANLLVSGSWFNIDPNDQIILIKHDLPLDAFITPEGSSYASISTFTRNDSITEPSLLNSLEDFNINWSYADQADFTNLDIHTLTPSTDTKSTTTIDNGGLFATDLPSDPVIPSASTLTSGLSVSANIPSGAVQVNYPIYNLKLKDYQLPVSLQYQSKGVRVMDVCGIAGMQWDLSTGGAIIRNVRGYPDDYHDKYYYYKYYGSWDYWHHHEKEVIGYLYNGDKYTYDYLSAKGDIKDELDDACFFYNQSAVNDSEPDEFSFSCGPYRGSFYFNPDGSIVVSSSSNIIVEYTREDMANTGNDYERLLSFTITTPDGVKYKYGVTESARETRYDANIQSFYTLSPEVPGELHANLKTSGYYHTEELDWLCTESFPCNCEAHYLLPKDDFGSSRIFTAARYYNMNFKQVSRERFHQENKIDYTYKWYLEEIETPSGNTIAYNYTSGGEVEYVTAFNESLSVSHLAKVNLDNFNVCFYVHGQDPLGNPTRICQPNPYPVYQFFGEKFVSPYHVSGGAVLDFSHQKVRYTPKYVSSISTSSGEYITFNMNSDRPDMPGARRLTSIAVGNEKGVLKSMDLGYTNWTSSETNEMPSLKIGGELETRYQFHEIDDPDGNTAEMLEISRHRFFLNSITEFDRYGNALPSYSLNYYDDVNLPRRISHHQSVGGFFIENPRVFRIDPEFEVGALDLPGYSTQAFRPLDPVYELVQEGTASGSLPGTDEMRFKAGLLKEIFLPSGSRKEIKYTIQPETWKFGCVVSEINQLDEDILLSSNKYSFEFPQNYGVSFSEEIPLGGYDASQMEIEYDEHCGNVNCKSDFEDPDGCNHEVYIVDNVRYTIKQYNGYSYNILKSNYSWLKSIIYDKVTVDKGDDGKIITNHNPYGYYSPTCYNESFSPVTNVIKHARYSDYSAEAGSLYNKQIQNSSGDDVIIETYVTPDDPLGGNFYCEGVVPYRIMYYDNDDNTSPKFFGAIYKNSTHWTNYTQSTKTETYGEGQEITTITDIAYDLAIKIPKEQTITSPTQEVDKIKTTYPQDYYDQILSTQYNETAVTGLKRLIMVDKINQPVERIQIKDGIVIGGHVAEYQDLLINGAYIAVPYMEYSFEENTGILETNFDYAEVITEPYSGQTISRFKISDFYQPVRYYDEYDEYGNLVEYHDYENIPVSFKYGYKGQYLIAKISNAHFNEFIFESFEDGSFPEEYHFNGFKYAGDYSGKVCFSDFSCNKTMNFVEGKKYVVSFWTKKGTSGQDTRINIAGIADIFKMPSSDYEWTYHEEVITIPAGQGGEKVVAFLVGNINSTPNMNNFHYIDNIQIYPVDARMETYTYDAATGNLTSQSNAYGITAKYEYDGFGRLKAVRDQDGNILEKTDYHYQGEEIDVDGFQITSPLSANNITSGEDVHATIEITNNGNRIAPCKVVLSLLGHEDFYFEDVLYPDNNATFQADWTNITGSVGTNLTVKASGDVSATKIVQIDPQFEVSNFTAHVSGRNIYYTFTIKNNGPSMPGTYANLYVEDFNLAQQFELNFTGIRNRTSNTFDFGVGCAENIASRIEIDDIEYSSLNTPIGTTPGTNIDFVDDLYLVDPSADAIHAKIDLKNVGDANGQHEFLWYLHSLPNSSPIPIGSPPVGAESVFYTVNSCQSIDVQKDYTDLAEGYYQVMVWRTPDDALGSFEGKSSGAIHIDGSSGGGTECTNPTVYSEYWPIPTEVNDECVWDNIRIDFDCGDNDCGRISYTIDPDQSGITVSDIHNNQCYVTFDLTIFGDALSDRDVDIHLSGGNLDQGYTRVVTIQNECPIQPKP